MARPRAKAKTVRVRYTDSAGVSTEYVSRRPIDLPGEYLRVQRAVLDAVRMINTRGLKRLRHVVLDISRFQLSNSLRNIPADSSSEEFAGEIARLSYLMHEVLLQLARLRHSRIDHLQELRFKLTYGQTPKKRELPGDRPKADEETEEADKDVATTD